MRFLICFLSLQLSLMAADEDSFSAYLLKIYETKVSSGNSPVLDFGFSQINNNSNEVPSLSLPNTPVIGIKYGFTRNEEELYYLDYYYHSFEYAFIETRNSYMFGRENHNRFNAWSFGFGWDDGYSFPGKKIPLELVHSKAIQWSRITTNDFTQENGLFGFQDNWRYGYKFDFGFNYSINDNVKIGFRQTNNLLFSHVKFFNYAGSFLLESFLQRLPLIFEKQLAITFNKAYPILFWLYKGFVSYTFYELQKGNGFWPLVGNESLWGRGFGINFKIIF